jgi:hypothetical protein
VCQHIFGLFGNWALAAADLAAKLRSGEVRAQVLFIRDDIKTQNLSPEFWNSIGIHPLRDSLGWGTLQNNVPDWMFAEDGRLGRGGRAIAVPLAPLRPDVQVHSVHLGSLTPYGIYFRREDVFKAWPVGPVDETAAPPRRRGKRPKHDWPVEVAIELLRRFGDPRKITESNKSALARELAQGFSDRWGWEPDDSELRKLIADLLHPLGK